MLSYPRDSLPFVQDILIGPGHLFVNEINEAVNHGDEVIFSALGNSSQGIMSHKCSAAKWFADGALRSMLALFGEVWLAKAHVYEEYVFLDIQLLQVIPILLDEWR